MEDYMSIIPNFSRVDSSTAQQDKGEHTKTAQDLQCSFFGVFDGHCNDNASAWFSENLPKELLKQPNFESGSIGNACLEADAAYRAYCALNKDVVQPGGTTGVFVILEEKQAPEDPEKPFKVTVGNVGDSRMLFYHNDRWEQISKDHKPNDLKERKRIFAAGGTIEEGRVNGTLAMSRAFGDHFLKGKSHLSAEEQLVTAVPDVFVIDNVGGSDMLLLMCDGVHERSSNNQTVAILRRFLHLIPEDPAIALSQLFNAQVQHSTDNMSAILVQFKDGSTYSKTSGKGKEIEYIPMRLREFHEYNNIEEENYLQLQHAFNAFQMRYEHPVHLSQSDLPDPKDSQGTILEKNIVEKQEKLGTKIEKLGLKSEENNNNNTNNTNNTGSGALERTNITSKDINSEVMTAPINAEVISGAPESANSTIEVM